MNPRSADEEYTKYSFPSKTIEHLATGVPVVMNRLPGIPEEYVEHLFLTEHSDAQSLTKMLQMVLDMDEQTVLEHGFRAIAFIQNEKNGTSQAKKIVELAKKLVNP